MLQNIDLLSYNFSELFNVWKIVDCDTQAGNSMTKVDIVRMLSGGGVGVWVNDDGNWSSRNKQINGRFSQWVIDVW